MMCKKILEPIGIYHVDDNREYHILPKPLPQKDKIYSVIEPTIEVIDDLKENKKQGPNKKGIGEMF